MIAGASRAAPTIAPQPALAASPQPRPAPTARALPPGLVEQGGQNWTPIGGQICKPIDRECPRMGRYRLAVLAERFGAHAEMSDVLDAVASSCRAHTAQYRG